jgi:hypothetical protein
MSDAPVPQSITPRGEPRAEAALLLSEAIADRHPVMALTGPRGSGKSAVVVAVIQALEGQPVTFLRIGNPLSTPLSLSRVLIQICGQENDEQERDEAARVMKALRLRTGGESRAVIVVEKAETLLAPAVRLLHLLTRISDPRLPLVQVLFVGGEAFWNLLQDQTFSVLRAQLATAVNLPAPDLLPLREAAPTVEEEPAALPPEDVDTVLATSVLVASPGQRLAERQPATRQGQARRKWIPVLGSAAIVVAGIVGAGLFYAQPTGQVAQSTVPAEKQVAVAVAPPPLAPPPPAASPAPVAIAPQSTNVPPVVAVTPTRPVDQRLPEPPAPRAIVQPVTPPEPQPRPPVVVQPQVAVPSITMEAGRALPSVGPATRRQLRQQFDVFLRQSRSDVAGLTNARRDELFEQYLARYLAQELTRGASGQEQAQNTPVQEQPRASGPTQPFTAQPIAPTPQAEAPRRPVSSVAGHRVVIHYKSTSDTARLAAGRMSSTLEATRTELRPVDAVPRAPSVRYFSPDDRDAARQLAAMLDLHDRLIEGDWDVQDFSTYRPRPPQGTIEVWLPPS